MDADRGAVKQMTEMWTYILVYLAGKTRLYLANRLDMAAYLMRLVQQPAPMSFRFDGHSATRREFTGWRRLGGGAGRTRTNHQSRTRSWMLSRSTAITRLKLTVLFHARRSTNALLHLPQ